MYIIPIVFVATGAGRMNHLEATSPETDTPDEARRAPVTDGMLPQTQLVCKVQEFAFFASRVGWYQRAFSFSGPSL
jgi:hypothetical protein